MPDPINYIEKGPALHSAVRAAGHTLVEENGVWLASDGVAVQSIIDAFDPLDAAKTAKLAELREYRWQREEAGVLVNGVAMDTARDARGNLTGAMVAAMVAASVGAPFAVSWKSANGVVVDVDGPTMLGLGMGVTGYVGACFTREAEFIAAIDAMTDWQAVAAFDFTAGWP